MKILFLVGLTDACVVATALCRRKNALIITNAFYADRAASQQPHLRFI